MSTRPLVAVLDYGIGNLHSAQKAIEHMGADARLTADPGLIADADGVVLPGRRRVRCVHGGPARRRPRAAGARRGRIRAGRSSGSVSGCRCCSRAARRRPARDGLGRDPGHDPLDPARRQAAADAVEPARRIRHVDDPMFAGLGDRAVDVLPALAARRARRPVGGRRDVRVRRDDQRRVSPRQRVRRRSSTPRSRASSGLALLGNFVRVTAGVAA